MKKRAASLIENNALLRLIVDGAREAVTVLDQQGKIMFANPGAAALLGMAARQLEGMQLSAVLPDQAVIGCVQETLQTGREGYIESFLTLQGQECWLETAIRPLHDEQGQVSGTVLLSTDVSPCHQMKRSLEESEGRYRLITENMNDTIWLMDAEFRVRYTTPSTARKLACQVEDLLHRPLGEHLTPESFELMRAMMAKHNLMADPGAQLSEQLDLQFRTCTGDTYWSENTFTFIRDPQGGLDTILAVGRDITDRKRIEAAIRIIEEGMSAHVGESFFESILLNLGRVIRSDFAFVGELLPDQKTIQTIVMLGGQQVLPNFTYSLPGTPCETVVGLAACAYPRDVARLFSTDTILTEMQIEGYVGIPLFNAGGLPIGIMVTLFHEPIREVNFVQSVMQIFGARVGAELERRSVERVIRASEARFRLLAESTTDIIARHSIDGTFLDVSPSCRALLGYEPDELIGRSAYEFIHQDDIASVSSAHAQMLHGSWSAAIHYRIHCRDGHFIWLESVGHALVDPDGTPFEIQVTSRDITERLHVQQALEQSEARLRSIIDSAPYGAHLYALEADGRLVFTGANRSSDTILGVESSQFIGKTIEEAFPNLAKTPIPDSYRHVALTGENYQTDMVEYEDQQIRGAFEVHALQTSPGQMAVFFRDVTERKKAEAKAQRQLERVTALRQIDALISSSLDLKINLNFVLEKVISLLGVDAADILLYREKMHMFDPLARRGFKTPAHPGLRSMSQTLAGQAALDRRVIRIPDLPSSADRALALPGQLESEGFIEYFAVPLIAKGEVKGVLEMFNRSPLAADTEWMDFMETLAGQAALVIDNISMYDDIIKANFELTKANQELKEAYDATLTGWANALELRDKETHDHTRRVTEKTLRVAAALNIPAEQMEHIRRGVLLHDIGKMGIPDQILHKTEPLNEDDWEIVRRHPQIANDLLKNIAFLKPALDIPFCHHERWDGSGYPRGLKGEQIPLAARIFAVVDVWDALTNDRIYRPAWSRQKAIDYIRNHNGDYFDPEVVEVFLKLVNTGSLERAE